ncbi:MAG: hypothetical protein L6Q38_14930, partial [Nitrospira sp.]|nr:hypothetical protein [Nitrospira sp.]
MTPKISIHTTMKPSMPRAFRSLRTYPALLLSGALSLGFLFFTGPAAHAARASGVAPSSEAPQLVATLQRPDATPYEKARACQQLAIVGDHQAVPALAALLPDPQLGAFARDALENIAHPSAGEALRNAVRQL